MASKPRSLNLFIFFLVPILLPAVLEFGRLGSDELSNLCSSLIGVHFLPIICSTLVGIFAITVYFASRPWPVYLVDHACFEPPQRLRVPSATYMEHMHLIPSFTEKTIEFTTSILERSGLGEETCFPPSLYSLPPEVTLEDAQAEAELVIFSVIDDLFRRTTGLTPCDIDILIVNGSVFSPTPSLSAMIINKYKLHSNIRSFNLSGMGCSAGLVSIALARDLLQVHPNSYCLVVSTEIITPNYYRGNQRAMLLPNCLFRMGGAVVLLSNSCQEKHRTKYRLLHVVRTHKGGDDSAYRCIYQEQDPEGNTGVNLSKDLTAIAGDTLRSNIAALWRLVLPVSEQLPLIVNVIGRKLIDSSWKPYVPDFKLAFEHFCIHAGGRAVIDAMQKGMRLSPEHVEPSRMTLHRFGNTSSSSVWYELSYIESKGRMKRGDRVWQIGLGSSGFKCNSAVWKCMRTIETLVDGPWSTCIHRYPVEAS